MASIISAGLTSGTSLNLSGDTSGVLQLASNGSTTAVTIDTSQRVGIGTASPTHRLQVEGNSGAEVKVTRGTNDCVISLSNNIGGAVFIGPTVASPLVLQTSNTERMRIDSSGNVCIGTNTTPNQQAVIYRTSATTSNGALLLDGNGSYAGVQFSVSGTLQGSISSDLSALYITHEDVIAFNTGGSGNVGGTERMRITSSGAVGIGTSSPAFPLDVRAATSVISAVSTTGTNSAYMFVSNTGGDFYLGRDNSTGGIFGTGTGYSAVLYSAGAYPMAFFTNATERMRITSIGFLKASNTGTYFSATGEYHELRSNQNNNVAIFENTQSTGNVYGPYIAFTGQNPNNTTSYFLQCAASGEKATIRSNGGIANFSANDVNLSDRREKTNFAPAKSYLDTICSIPVQTFNYIDQNMEEDGGLTLGVVAQDVQAVAPELVMESNWAGKDQPEKMRLSIYQTDLQYALMKSIQELNAKVEAQAAEIAALKGVN
jgi:hypothetical protein